VVKASKRRSSGTVRTDVTNLQPKHETLIGALAAAVTVSVLACSPIAAPPLHRVRLENAWAPSSVRRSVVLIAIDGVRFQEVFDGVDPRLAKRHGIPEQDRVGAKELVPNLSRLMEEGTALGDSRTGVPMLASGPNYLSMPGYSEMLSGRVNSGCRDNDCGRISASTVVDDVARFGLGRAAVITSWPRIEKAAAAFPEDADMSVGRHAGSGRSSFEEDPAVRAVLEVGENAGPDPGYGDFRRDAETGELALAVFQTRRPAFMFIGLGETDEYAHRENYRGYLDALSRADRLIGRFAEIALHDPGAPTTLFVTTDHGRSEAFTSHGGEYPESARVWLVAAGAGIENRGQMTSPVTRRLANVAPTVRSILGIAQADETEGPLSELFAAPPEQRDQRALR
jgi:hypothetical protein